MSAPTPPTRAAAPPGLIFHAPREPFTAPPATREAELAARRVDVIMTDFPTAIKVTDEFDWASYLLPPEKLAVTPYSYVVPPGDQIWLNYVNLFVDTIKLDGRLLMYAKKHKLDPIVAP